ncbi:Alpha/Beta hydrolase protein [Phialemonium atrogriseum]|uniref:Alpha/Beta hydrolase protein n=1 Tax=Phialemonium atrogriseum TaxID=1093897 RepID=A0AAJ0FH65_9PEZI|nr:Alpha/Beta hydrolase protein [Phialemonium atrogriseum]KAK1767367.1 Alpha/Beta hydrolase protein [Phialemonium atrogriseum]
MELSVKPFQINVAGSKLESLEKKLSLAEFTDDTPMSDNWDYGAPVSDIKRLFTTNIAIDGFGKLQIHFAHKKSGRPGSISMLFCHGLAPSLPNFGFSQGPSKPGFGIPQYAECMHKLMLKLGYDKYVTQGGDWGFSVTCFIGILFPEHCLASHLNYVHTNPPTPLKHPLLYLQNRMPRTARERAGLARTQWFFEHSAEKRTRPATLSHALADSPVALLAWIHEKLHDWTDAYPWTGDEVLTWVSVYWFLAAGPAASVRAHLLRERAPARPAVREHNPRVRLGLSYFQQDLLAWPRCYGRTLGPVVFRGRA